MTKSPSKKLPKVFILITPQVIQIHRHFVGRVVVVVCRSRRGIMMRIFVLIIPQVVRIQLGERTGSTSTPLQERNDDIDIVAA
jgi:hypothetical protein